MTCEKRLYQIPGGILRELGPSLQEEDVNE